MEHRVVSAELRTLGHVAMGARNDWVQLYPNFDEASRFAKLAPHTERYAAFSQDRSMKVEAAR